MAREARELDARKIKGRKPSFARNVFHVGALGGKRARTPSNDFERTQIPGPGNPSILGQGDLRVAHCESRRETLPGRSGWPEKLESWTPGKLRDESPASPGMCFTLEHSGGIGPVRPATILNVRKFQAQETPQFSGKETSAWLTVNLAERPCPVGQGGQRSSRVGRQENKGTKAQLRQECVSRWSTRGGKGPYAQQRCGEYAKSGPGNPSILGQGDLRVAHCESRRVRVGQRSSRVGRQEN